jgi:hypothetical protein
MTVKELIEKLKEFPEDTIVLLHTGGHDDELYVPEPALRQYDFTTTFWDGFEIFGLSKNTLFLEL